MAHQAVKSSTIKSVDYRAGTRTLEIAFHSGGTYTYANVPPRVVHGLTQAESKGKYFHAHIKGTYTATKQEK